jgi:hypothetical protein
VFFETNSVPLLQLTVPKENGVSRVDCYDELVILRGQALCFSGNQCHCCR